MFNPVHIFIFGPSCSGKSTLAEALEKRLGKEWVRIDRDDLIEQGVCDEKSADRVLDQKIQATAHRVIIDTQIPWREKLEGELYFLVLPPLATLLERDDRRTTFLGRTPERAQEARSYVIETHRQLSALSQGLFNGYFDSSALSLEEEIVQVQEMIRTYSF